MKDIYQKIWDADQSESGVRAILDTETGDETKGYVKVNSRLESTRQDLRVLTEVKLPRSKERTYNLCRKLFDNYALAERDEEHETAKEREEIHDLVHAMIDTAPMQVAREYVAEATATHVTRERWYNTLMDHWFRRFSSGGDPHLTGFEHVVVGEQEGAKAQGYHFWYKYYLDDGFARLADADNTDFIDESEDRIVYLGPKQDERQGRFPESVTVSYRWHAPDYDRNQLRPLTKRIGGFFVGCSVEGLLALGSVRAHLGAQAPKMAVINGARYSMKLFRSPNKQHIRTFYPVFQGPVDGNDNGNSEPITVRGDMRIIAALINPERHDPGRETVTLINQGVAPQSLQGWRLQDKNGRTEVLQDVTVADGDTIRIVLSGAGVQLSNKGGGIRLLDPQGNIVHAVTYSKGQARQEKVTTLF